MPFHFNLYLKVDDKEWFRRFCLDLMYIKIHNYHKVRGSGHSCGASFCWAQSASQFYRRPGLVTISQNCPLPPSRLHFLPGIIQSGFSRPPILYMLWWKNQNIHSVPNVTSHFSLLRNKDNYFLSNVPKGTICGLKVGFHICVQSFVYYKGKM